MDKLYIITGAAGHLADTIIRYLRKTDCLIRGLILPTEYRKDTEKVKYYRGDVTIPESMEDVFAESEKYETYVIHAAGIISIEDRKNPLIYKVNIGGTKNIIRQCLSHKVKRLIYISSVHALPANVNMATIAESAVFSGSLVTGDYARSKAEATRTVLDSVRWGLDAVVVLPSGIIGPYDAGRNHIVQLIKMYITGRLPVSVTGGFDFVDVRDAAQGCIKAIRHGITGSCYILSNRYYTIKEILEYARKAIGGRRPLCIPAGVANAFAPLCEWAARLSGTRPLFTKYALSTLAANIHFTHDKATAELGYRPRDMRITIVDTISWLRKKNPCPFL